MQPALAAAPIAVLLLLMIGLRWTAASAGAASALAAALIAVTAFEFSSTSTAGALVGAAVEALFSGMMILWIIFAALVIYEYQNRSGAFATLQYWLQGFGAHRGVAVLLVAWFFALFLEGAAGFGTPVALAAPLLVGMGVPPVRALTAVLIGHAVGVSFGALGTPILPLVLGTGLQPSPLSFGIAAVHGVLGWVLAVIVLRQAHPQGAIRTSLLAAGCFLVPFFLIAWAVGPELPTLGGAIVGMAAFLAVARLTGGGEWPAPPSAMIAAAAPYLAVIALVLATKLAGPIRTALSAVVWSWELPGGFGGTITPLVHPGTLLLAGLVAAAVLQGGLRGHVLPALAGAAERLPKVAVALFSVLLLSRILVHAGMTDVLAQYAAAFLGEGWPFASPGLGALGSFITGSATASNILFSSLQQEAAIRSSTDPLLAGIGQGVGAAIGNMIAPHNIVAGAATVGLVGAEAAVLRRTLPVCVLYALAAGLLLLAAGWLAGG